MRDVRIASVLITAALLLIGILSFSFYCKSPVDNGVVNISDDKILSPQDKTIRERILPPEGFTRIETVNDSWAEYLSNLPLKPNGSPVKYFNGQTKSREVHVAVVDMDIDPVDLQQCADAIMRLRAEYLYQCKRLDEIHFNFTNGFNAEYSRWMNGERIKVQGNKVSWYVSGQFNDSYKSFRKYMKMVFMYAGTLSLSKELKTVKYTDMQIGDVLIQGGSPGHAVIVVDMCINKQGEKLYLLAQSYMPAQEIHILKNNGDHRISPWYELNPDKSEIKTPEWKFYTSDLKRF